MPIPQTTIIIPQYRHLDLTLACLRTLRETDPHPWPVIVVDDGSPDDCWLAEIERSPHVTSIRQPHRGVTAAWNVGWQAARTECVVFLNNDVVSRGGWVERLLTPLAKGDALMTGVRMRREEFLPRALMQRLPARVFLEGWCFALSRRSLQQLDGFDPELATYWSDTDLQLRLMKNRLSRSCGVAGVESSSPQQLTEPSRSPLLSLPDLPIEHIGHVTAHDSACLPQRRQLWQADRERFIAKWK
ncbi:MAG: glycosyltransferase [Planctomycetaceae bacterium]